MKHLKLRFAAVLACSLAAGSVFAGGLVPPGAKESAKNASEMGWNEVRFKRFKKQELTIPNGVPHCNWAGLYRMNPGHTDWTKLALPTTRTADGVKVGMKCYFKIVAQRDAQKWNSPYEPAIAVMIAK